MTSLLIGGTGKTGSRVADRLSTLGHPVRIGSRSSHTRFDWDDSSTWVPALQGCSSAYITYQPDLTLPGAAEAIEQLVKTALAEGVTRLVLLSGRGEEEARRAEEVLQHSGADWTVVRSAFFSQNFSESIWTGAIAAGDLTMVKHGAGEPFVDADDIADVVVEALTKPGHGGQVYELTGPRLLTFAEVAQEIGRATGRTITYREVPVEEFAAGLEEVGLSPADAEGVAHLFVDVLDGRNAHLTDGVRRALGREPRDFSAYVERTAATGVWKG